MLKHHINIALRNFRRDRRSTFINLFGLGVGIACCLLIGIYVFDELSYDRFHRDADRIHRVVREVSPASGEAVLQTAFSGSRDWSQVPGIERDTWFFTNSGTVHLFYHGDRRFPESNYLYVSPEFFDVFTFEFLQGSPEHALEQGDAIVLTESAARKYFPDSDPMGKTVTRLGFETHTVTAVIRDVPEQTHLDFDFLLTTSFDQSIIDRIPRTHYVVVAEKSDSTAVIEALNATQSDARNAQMQFQLQRAVDIHFHPAGPNELKPPGSLKSLFTLAGVAVLILAMACINFVNMLIARSLPRAREIGIRKSFGARRSQVARQFLTEAVATALAAIPIALILIRIILPAFNTVAGKSLTFEYAISWPFWISCFVLLMIVGLIAGSYPAFFLSSFRPVSALAGRVGSGSSRFRSGLVVVQIALSVGLLASTLTMYSQMDFIQDRELGWDKENLLILPGAWIFDSETRFESFKQELLQHPAIEDAARLSFMPGWAMSRGDIFDPENQTSVPVDVFRGTAGFTDVLGISIVEGTGLDPETANGSSSPVLINEALAARLGRTAVTGRTLSMSEIDGDGAYTVVGVIPDIHMESMRQQIGPAVYTLPRTYRQAIPMYIRSLPGEMANVLSFVRDTWRRNVPARHFEYAFADDEVATYYGEENRLFTILGYFSILGILVAGLGLYGLSMYTAERRLREVGIRKVFGASISDICILLTSHFVRLGVLAILFALPITYLVMNRWLQEFAYRTPLRVELVVVLCLTSLFVVTASVGFRAFRAARTRPVVSLRQN